MGHVPHLYLPPPWGTDFLSLDARHRHHLQRVLRMTAGDPVTYTDGAGTIGRGRLAVEAVERGTEGRTDPDNQVSMAVAPPEERERQRFLVEKLAELGVHRLMWLAARFGEGRPPPSERARAWTIAALEQSGGARLLEIDHPSVPPSSVDGWVTDPGGDDMPVPTGPVTLLVGPAGGWAPEEVAGRRRVRLGVGILRVETAAVVAAALVLDRLRSARTSHLE